MGGWRHLRNVPPPRFKVITAAPNDRRVPLLKRNRAGFTDQGEVFAVVNSELDGAAPGHSGQINVACVGSGCCEQDNE